MAARHRVKLHRHDSMCCSPCPPGIPHQPTRSARSSPNLFTALKTANGTRKSTLGEQEFELVTLWSRTRPSLAAPKRSCSVASFKTSSKGGAGSDALSAKEKKSGKSTNEDKDGRKEQAGWVVELTKGLLRLMGGKRKRLERKKEKETEESE